MGKLVADYFSVLGEAVNTLVQLFKMAVKSREMNPGEVSPVFNTRPDSPTVGE